MTYEHCANAGRDVWMYTAHMRDYYSFHNGYGDYDEGNMVLSFIELL